MHAVTIETLVFFRLIQLSLSSSIFDGEKEESLIRNDLDKSELSLGSVLLENKNEKMQETFQTLH